MLNRRFRVLTLGLITCLTCSAVALQQNGSAKDNALIDRLMRGPIHSDIAWKVKFFEPRLMYQQRYLVQVRARLPIEIIRGKPDRSLHFVLRAEDQESTRNNQQFNDYKVPPDLGNQSEVEYATGVYFRPGNYVLTLAVWDSDSEQTSVARKLVRIPALKDDPFPELDQYLAPVEFSRAFPDIEVASDEVNSGELFPVARTGEQIPIVTSQPVLVDIVLNITKRAPPGRPSYPGARGRELGRPAWFGPPARPAYPLDVGRVLQIGNVLAHLAIQHGCVRVSAIDVLRMKTIMDRVDEKALDWENFEVRFLNSIRAQSTPECLRTGEARSDSRISFSIC